ncbi:MAG: hypothetical protein EHM70_26000 [Chloroflexota bacterium]|nr:MAG: hypothetical protein EHM70_26000 [Chloroflexota bacterium]
MGQPTSFFVGCALNLIPANPEDEIKNLGRKLRAGADFILTQPVYEAGPALAFLDRARNELGSLDVPVIVGVLPLVNPRHAAFLHHEVPGIDIPEKTLKRMEDSGENAARTGREIAIELIQQLRGSINGVYLMPAFSRYDLIAEVIDNIATHEPVS